MLRLFMEGSENPIYKNWKFNKRNINRLAYNYDAKVEKYEPEVKFALLRCSVGHLISIDNISLRSYSKCK